MKNKTKIFILSSVIILLAVFLSLDVMAKNDNSKSGNSGKSSQSKEKKEINLKNFEKADASNGRTNAKIHKEKIETVVKNLDEVAKKEKTIGNVEANNKIQQIAKEQETVREQNAGAIEQIENRNKFKNFLIGTDYKNLGQLRSSLVHNRNQIRELTITLAQVQNETDKVMIQEQLQTLMQERERIKAVITENESGFSILGWVSRFINNYEETPINEEDENDLTEEVEEAIEGSQI